jgi:RNA polymerase sigma-70 factor (ECF subfamily)
METLSTDELIVQRALGGDAEAFGELVRRWERRIFALTYGLLGREEDARDATQETFLAAFRNLRGFRGEAKVSSWLHRIALEDDVDATGGFAAPADYSPASVVEGRQRTAAVRRALNGLPLELRQVVVMKEFEELTFREIAEALDLPLSTVKSRLYTGLKQLQMRLAKFGDEGS